MVIRELFARARQALEFTENARFEAEQLLCAAGIDRIKLLTEPSAEVSPEEERRFLEMLRRRQSGEPLQYILGEWEFYGLPFAVGEGVLIPRQDTETLCETALDFLETRDSGFRLSADLCAGSGCVGITLAKKANAQVLSYELSEKALVFLRRNIELNGADSVCAIRGDILSEELIEAAPTLDLIVSNPPYLTARDMTALQTEVSHEPQMALFGGEDGLSFYRAIAKSWTRRLKSGGMLAVEIGMGQEESVSALFKENGITPRLKNDACGICRVVYGIKQ